MDILQIAASIGGFSGFFAVLVLYVYRHDRKDSENRLTKIIEADQKTREKNTQALTELIVLIQKLNGRL